MSEHQLIVDDREIKCISLWKFSAVKQKIISIFNNVDIPSNKVNWRQ